MQWARAPLAKKVKFVAASRPRTRVMRAASGTWQSALSSRNLALQASGLLDTSDSDNNDHRDDSNPTKWYDCPLYTQNNASI